MPEEYTDEQEDKLGEVLAELFGLKKQPDGRYLLGRGFHTKTNTGLFRVVRDLGRKIENGDIHAL